MAEDLTDDEEGFVELLPGKPKVIVPVALKLVTFGKAKTKKLSLSMNEEFFAPLKGEPRFRVAWNEKQLCFRIKGDKMGGFEVMETQRGNRRVIRLPCPVNCYPPDKDGTVPKTEFTDQNTLYVYVPMEWMQRALPKPGPVESQARSHAQDVRRRLGG